MLLAPSNLGGGGGLAIGASVTGATQGSVFFAGPSGSFTQNNSKFFWDNTNENLGIGTNTPSPKLALDVTSTTKAFAPPRMNNTQMYAIPSPVEGSLIYHNEYKAFYGYNLGFGFGWQAIFAPFYRPLYFAQTQCEFQEQGQYGTNKVLLQAPASLAANCTVDLPSRTGVISVEQTASTVAGLPAATTPYQRYFVSDALSPVFGSTVVGGGSVKVPVYSDGTNWIVG